MPHRFWGTPRRRPAGDFDSLVSDSDAPPVATPEYRGRRRATPTAPPPEAPEGSSGPDESVDAPGAVTEPEPPPLTRRQLLEQRRAADQEAVEESGGGDRPHLPSQAKPFPQTPFQLEPSRTRPVQRWAPPAVPVPAPATRRQLAEQRRRQETRAGHGPSLSAVALGAASVAMVAVVAGHAFGAPPAQASAAEVSTTATTTADQVAPKVDPKVAAAALRMGESPKVPSGLRAVSRSKIRPVLPGCSGVVTDYSYPNGHVPGSELCALAWVPRHHLRADAAVALARLNIAYRARFGHDLCLTDSYRSLASQESLAARKPGLAARPGTSEHGLGLAVDLCAGVQTFRSTQYDWMRANAPAFGWQNPAWAVPPSSREEPWHWEYVVGETHRSSGE